MAKNNFDARLFLTALRREARELPPARPTPRVLLNLLKLDGEDFVREAYLPLLHREADAIALATYGPKACNPWGKLLILGALLLSPERCVLPPALLRALKQVKGLFS